MTLEEVLLYTNAALKDACFSKTLIEGIPKFIQNQADENRKLKRTLWLARAERAFLETRTSDNWYNYMAEHPNSKVTIGQWLRKFKRAYTKCRAMADKFKEEM